MHTEYRKQIRVLDESGTGVGTGKAVGKSTQRDVSAGTSSKTASSKASKTASYTTTDVCCLSKVGMVGCVTVFEFDLGTRRIREYLCVPEHLLNKDFSGDVPDDVESD